MEGERNVSGEYRYGYQGSEMDNELKDQRNSYTTHFRQLDVRIGRWLTIDPMAISMPYQSPYCSMDNNPIWFNDVFGDSIKYDEKMTESDIEASGEKRVEYFKNKVENGETQYEGYTTPFNGGGPQAIIEVFNKVKENSSVK